MYTIADLERVSGIKSHTIRMWEKRYDLFSPMRTEGNHRLYSDDDFLKLLNISRFVKRGHRISTVAKWSESEMLGRMTELQESFINAEHAEQFFLDEILAGTISYNENRIEQACTKILEKAEFEFLWSAVFLPALQRIGVLWMSKKINPAQEHFLSNFIRRKLEVAIDALPVPSNQKDGIVLFLPSDELHELGLLMCQYLIRKMGVAAIYLGQNVPGINVEKCIKTKKPRAALLFCNYGKISNRSKKFLEQWDSNIDIPLLIAGQPGRLDTAFFKSIDSVKFITKIEDLKTYLVQSKREVLNFDEQ